MIDELTLNETVCPPLLGSRRTHRPRRKEARTRYPTTDHETRPQPLPGALAVERRRGREILWRCTEVQGHDAMFLQFLDTYSHIISNAVDVEKDSSPRHQLNTLLLLD